MSSRRPKGRAQRGAVPAQPVRAGESSEVAAQTTYALRCPRCGAKAIGHMVADGIRGSYREVYLDFRAERITCPSCGIVGAPADGGYELYFKTNHKGETLWARNEAELDALIEFLTSGRSATGTRFEALPQWLVRDRAKVVAKLRRLRAGAAP